LQQAEKPYPTRSRAVSPIKAFLALAVVAIAAMAAVWSSGRELGPSKPPAAPPATAGLASGQDPLDVFREIRNQILEAIRARDSSRATAVVVSNSDLIKRIRSEVAELTRDDVIDRSKIEVVAERVASADANRIIVREVLLIAPCFMQGRQDVTEGDHVVRQVATWTLVRQDDEWRAQDAVIGSVKREGRRDSCT